MAHIRRYALGVVFSCTAACAQPTTAPDGPFVLPPVRDDPSSLAGQETLTVRGFRFEGNTVVSSAELSQVADPIAARSADGKVTLDQLEEIRQALTDLYTSRGYTTSGALLPEQDIADGLVTYRIIEGKLAEIHWEPIDMGRKSAFFRLRESYLRDRVRLGGSGPLNVNDLRDRLELLREDGGIQQLNAELKPGLQSGESVLSVRYAETPPITLALSFNNHHPPSSGAERFETLGSIRNIVGVGDQFSFTYGITTGGWQEMKFSGVDNFSLNYAFPLNARDTTLIFDVQRSNDSVVEEPFAELGISSDSWSYSLTLRHSLYYTRTAEFAVYVTGAYRTNYSTLDGEGFDFSPGSVEGRTKISVIRIGQEFNKSGQNNAIALRSAFSIGTDWFNATNNGGDIADSQFFAWLGQAQYVQKLGKSDNRLVLRAATQLTADRLPSLEQFTIGGVDTVRGYRENRLVRDNGFTASAELHIPIIQRASVNPILEFVPFVDAGYGKDNHEFDAVDRRFISSAGAGFIFKPIPELNASLFYGYPFQQFPDHDNIQDNGIHFDVTFSVSF